MAGGLALAMALPATAATATPGAKSAPAAQKTAALPKSGIWTALSTGMTTEAPAPALWVAPNGVGWDVFPREISPNVWTYEATQVGTSGKVIKGPADIFATHWGSLEFPATLLGVGAKPLLVFSGAQGSSGVYSLDCVYGALGSGSAKWALESWSLSASCVNPVAAAAESNANANVLAAAWPGGFPGGNGVLYRIGLSTIIPAVPADQHIALSKADAGQAATVNDQAGNHHFYVAWTRIFSTPGSADGIYVKDVTANGVIRKAPGSGTASSSTDFPVFGRLASVNRNGKGGGVYLAYCANKSPCPQLELWKVGAAKALAVPSSANALNPTLAQGPGGRIWVAWSNRQSNRVFVTRTNKAGTRFGAVRSYATPCFDGGLLGLGGSPLAKLDIGMTCVNNALKQEQYVTQVLAGLSLSFPGTVHLGSKGVTVKITVTDAGDPVAGATVKFAGKTLKTNAKGQVSVTLAKSAKTGGYKISVTAPNYAAAGGTVSVKK
ncbi:hypothetical protein EAS64_19300 [Trebonia kvetii]|uniref:Big-1 domain-containing protein n=1 Tax=Trebonia kvetii TaxID=2480626 RepID=A0A6P2C0N4_9ACTN|nr:hypothetical protein [Trebonia kvetii]TVZ04507.1 hypothetical protein EAS64_19300 [Trebonia kvetii]